MDSLSSFEPELIRRLSNLPVASVYADEGAVERQVVIPVVQEVLRRFPTLHVYAHPWRHKERRCPSECSQGQGLIASPEVRGCAACWEASKKWAAVDFYGIHCFDLVVGERGNSLAVDVKLFKRAKAGNRRKNGEWQRFIGQCRLARLVHKRVIGFAVAEERALGAETSRLISDESSQQVHPREQLISDGITLIVRAAGTLSGAAGSGSAAV